MGFEWFWSFFHILSMCDRLLVLELFGKKKSRMWRTKEPDQCHPTPWVLSAAGQVRTQVGAEERWVRCREGQWTERSQNSGDAKETSAGFPEMEVSPKSTKICFHQLENPWFKRSNCLSCAYFMKTPYCRWWNWGVPNGTQLYVRTSSKPRLDQVSTLEAERFKQCRDCQTPSALSTQHYMVVEPVKF